MTSKATKPSIAVIIGSDSDLEVVDHCLKMLDEFELGYELRILSAHRTPEELTRYVRRLEGKGVKVIIAAAGLSAALPGCVAAQTALPVIGIPVDAGALGGVDALLSISQMPPGVPVAAVTIGSSGARNAALLAARIIALNDRKLGRKVKEFADQQRKKVLAKDRQVRGRAQK